MSVAAGLLMLATLGQSFVLLNGHICPNEEIVIDMTKKTILASSTCEDAEYCYDDPQTGLKECTTCTSRQLVDVSNIIDGNITTHWISQPGVAAVNLTLDLIQVCVAIILVLAGYPVTVCSFICGDNLVIEFYAANVRLSSASGEVTLKV